MVPMRGTRPRRLPTANETSTSMACAGGSASGNSPLLGRRAVFKHEQGALYVACLLLDPPPEPIHAVALALKARKMNGQSPGEAELIQERNLGLDDAEAVRNLRRKQRELEAVLDDGLAIEPVKAEARREREEILEFLRKNSWRNPRQRGAVCAGCRRCDQALPRAPGQGGGRGGQAASGLARLCAASAGAPADSFGPGRGPWRGEGKLVGDGVLYLRAAARRDWGRVTKGGDQ